MTIMAGAAMMVMCHRATTMLAVWFTCILLLQAPRTEASVQDLRISEFMAKNTMTLKDKDGDFSDWIEIHNTGDVAVDLTGLYLTVNVSAPSWTFPSITLSAKGYLIVFTDKKTIDPAIELHASFKLSASGKYIGLLAVDGHTVISEYAPAFPSQKKDVSYGIDSNGDIRYFSIPTPGAPNGVGELPAAAGVVASVDRGFYDTAFTVQLNTTQHAAQIHFTTDGSEPSAINGKVYQAPIAITTTTVLRATTLADGYAASPISTYSYIFLGDVIHQPAYITGFPNSVMQSTGTKSVPNDMAMDSTVVNNYTGEILRSMKAIPTMSLTASLDDIFGSNGFYFDVNGTVEKKSSIEILYGSTPGTNEQIDVGVGAHSWNRLKRSFNLKFNKVYGKKEWKTTLLQSAPVNGHSATSKHRYLILRGGNNRCWARDWNSDATTYTEDQFYRDSQVAMSGIGSRGTFIHLYLNGVYWGVYNLVERADDNYESQYFGGSKDDWFYTNQGGAGTADPTRWKYLTGALSRKNMSLAANYAEMQQYLNVTSFSDYMLLSFYIGITDWPANNWYFGYRLDTSPFGSTPGNYFAWDGEWSFDRRQDGSVGNGAYIQRVFIKGTGSGSASNVVKIWRSLWASPAFRALFADRVKLHTSSGGALSSTASIARWDALNSYIQSAIVGESARWGDSLKTLGGIYAVTHTRDVDWYAEVARIRGILHVNTQTLINALEKAGFFSQLTAPGILPTAPTAPIALTKISMALKNASVVAPVASIASAAPVPASNPQPTAPNAAQTPTSSAFFTLIDANADTDIGSLTDGMTVNLLSLGNLNVRANFATYFIIGSVQFRYDGSVFRTENGVPYTLAGENHGNYKAWTPRVGNHTIVAIPFSGKNAAGTMGDFATVTFTVINQTKI